MSHEKMRRRTSVYSGPGKFLRGLAGRSVLGLTCFGLVVVVAQNATNNATEPWTAPSRAARKQNPIPADEKSLGRGKELFVMGCMPCHGPEGRGDGPAAGTLERNG